MSDTQLYLGLDLDPEYTQLSYYNVDTREPESVYHKEARDTYMLPNIMFYSAYNKKSDDGQSEAYKFIDLAGWCAGAKASACRFEENGTVVDQVYERTLRNENIEVAGRNYKAGDLLVKMMILHIRQFTEQFARIAKEFDLVFKELFGGGKGTLEDPGDRRVIGNSSPRYQYGLTLNLSWYGFDLSVFMQGIGRLDWYPGADNLRFWGPYSRPYATFIPKNFMSQVWSESNPDAYLPRARAYTSLNSTQGVAYYTNDRYLQNLAYCRLKNLTLGYTIPKRLTSKVGIKECRVYFSGENLATWSALKNDFLDPEQAAADSDKKSNVYPWCRTYSVGLNLTF